MRKYVVAALVPSVIIVIAACGSSDDGVLIDTSSDAGGTDGATSSQDARVTTSDSGGGTDTGTDTGVHVDSGTDSGTDAGVDSGPTCAQTVCGNGATCSVASGSPVCSCNPGFSGDGGTCTQIPNCAGNPCQNGATCADGNNGYTCTCAPGYSGTTCETNINDCATNPCANGGTCVDGVNSFTCNCAPGYSGTTCQTNIDDCATSPCASGGTCVDGVNSFTCNCAPGYSGTTCQTNIDDCAALPCLNGGGCTDGVNSFTCECVNGYTDATCATLTTSCSALKAALPATPSGSYLVDPDGAGGDAPFRVYCDMVTDGGGWTSVFKTSAGALNDANALWSSATPVNDGAADCSDPLTSGANAYCVNLFVTKYWNANGITFNSARVHAYTGGTVSSFMRFDGVTASKTAWYAQTPLASSSWTDLKTGAPNFFSVAGDSAYGRNFFVNSFYGGCGVDTGWFIVTSTGGGSNKPCSWETAPGTGTRILYSTTTTASNWNNTPTVGSADTMMVFVK